MILLIVVIIIAIIVLTMNIINPAFAWHLRGGWNVKGDSEPSEEFLFTQRIAGILGLIVLVPLLIGILIWG